MSSTASLHYRPFAMNDLDPTWQLRLRALKDHPEAFGEPYQSAASLAPENVEARAQSWSEGDNRLFLALTSKDEPVGMLGIRREERPREQHRAFIWGVYVAPEYRGYGVAAHLMQAAIDHARSTAGVLQIHLSVTSTNDAAIRSYVRFGFQRWGTMPRADIVDGVPYDHDSMVLLLDQSNTVKGHHDYLPSPDA